jgi:hypothetical protein
MHHISPNSARNPQPPLQEKDDRAIFKRTLHPSRLSVCKIVFQKVGNEKTKRSGSQSKGEPQSARGQKVRQTIEILPSSNPNKTKNYKFLSEYSMLDHPLQGLLDQLTHTRSKMSIHKHSLSQSLDATHRSQRPQGEDNLELLSINRVTTINPEDDLLKTLRGSRKDLHPEGNLFSRRNRNLPDISRISFYNADGINIRKKPNGSNFKELGSFEPWVGVSIEEEEFVPASEIQK